MRKKRKKEMKIKKAKQSDKIMVVGNNQLLGPIASALSHVRADIIRKPWSSDIVDEIDPSLLAIVLAAPIPRLRLARAVELVRAAPLGAETAVFAVVPGNCPVTETRALLSAGASAVFEWPREAAIFPICAVEMIAAVEVRGKAKGSDAALARRIRSQLRTMPGQFFGIRASVRGGVALLSGSVDFLWKKQSIHNMVSVIPGIRSVVVKNLNVAPSDVPDSRIRKSIQRLLKTSGDIDESTMSVAVNRGYVTLAGTVRDRRELSRIVELMGGIEGVRGTENYVVVSGKQKERDRTVARRLDKMTRFLFPDSPVSTAVFGNVAVLSGRVKNLAVKRDMEKAVASDDAIARTVNKIEVRTS